MTNHTDIAHIESYKALILDYLMTGQELSPMHALDLWGCWSLSQRITELKQAGYPISARMVTAPNGKRHAIYWLDADYIATAQ